MEAEENSTEREIECGRAKFRDADLAFLLIDQDRLFPLAELLSSVFSNTARTTLFTRMERIGTRRHFCNAPEIRLLKTVNGIHGSSAICTLIPEADVQLYCEIYIDGTKDLKLHSVSKRIRKSSKKHKSQETSDSVKDTDVNQADKASSGEHSPTSDPNRVVGSKIVKTKRRKHANKQGSDDSAKTNGCRKGRKKVLVINSEQLCEYTGLGGEGLSAHVTTNNMRKASPSNKKPTERKKLAVKAKASIDGNDFNQTREDKRLQTIIDDEQELYSPFNVLESVNVNEPEAKQLLFKTGESTTNDFRAETNAGEAASNNNHHGQNLASCLKNANSEILFSDASSNDSGFASTATLSLKTSSTFSTPVKESNGNDRKRTKSPSSSSKAKKVSPKKLKLDHTQNCSTKNDVSLSPPALVIKRQNNTWQVETKQEQERLAAKLYKQCVETARKSLEFSEGEKQTENIKNVHGKHKKLQPANKTKGVISVNAENGTLASDGKNVAKKRRRRRKKIVEGDQLHLGLPVNGLNHSFAQDYSANAPGKKLFLKKFKGKRGRKGKLIINHAFEGVKGAVPPKTIDKSTLTAGCSTSTSSNNAVLNNNNFIPRKRTVKAYRNFKLLSMFPAFPSFEVRDRDLTTEFTMAVEQGVKAPSWHPIWKWHLGAPVVEDKHKGVDKHRNNMHIKINSLATTPVKIG